MIKPAVHRLASGLVATLAFVTVLAWPAPRAEAYDCTSSDPADWPLPAKPYFMIAFDTSGSMNTGVGSNNSCGYAPLTWRASHGRCAVYNTLLSYAGEVNFGLASFPVNRTCTGTCYNTCSESYPLCGSTCGCNTGVNRQGAIIRVPMMKDAAGEPSNLSNLLSWVDGTCSGTSELFASGSTPLNGILRDMYRYLSNQWTLGATTYTSPLTSTALGERDCRSVNIILVTDGDETCDTQADAVDAAADLYAGFTKDGITWHVRTHVIKFSAAAVPDADQIADAGDDGLSNSSRVAYTATNEVQLSQALADIIASAMQPEVCNNADDNCNGCIDEGYNHYCNLGQTCTAWTTPAQRTAALAAYRSSISPADPDGDLSLLPCTTVAQSQASSTWLCYNPGDTCDGADNNCYYGIDEGQNQCGNPLHCPTTEVCDGQDNDCDGQVDEGVCSNCVPSPEVCDGCDNDCDGVIDNPPVGGFPTVACGLPDPANCVGERQCLPPVSAAVGTCVGGRGYGACSYDPDPEVCDGEDNDCNGAADDGLVSVPCLPAGYPPGLTFGAPSQCQQGSTVCSGGVTQCLGGVWPSVEVCDGVDNDCDGVVDDHAAGTGLPCGIDTPPCQAGVTACVNGAIVCQGGVAPQPEVCDGVDNDCDGSVDEWPLADGPPAGQQGCWNLPGACCSFGGLTWCPPSGATCSDAGTLTDPCRTGMLLCDGGAWVCDGDRAPSAEVCDGEDNDCNGLTDEDGTGDLMTRTCYAPGFGPATGCAAPGDCTGACSDGVQTCESGDWGDCVGEVVPTSEVCDATDNDCDGQVDEPEDLPWLGQACPASEGVCNGVWECNAGVKECVGSGTAVGRCNGADDNCNGVIDELDELLQDPEYHEPCGDATGLCEPGAKECVNGAWVCVGAVGPSDEVCDGDDNDCDGDVDIGAVCPPVGQLGSFCIDAACRVECNVESEFPCPPGLECVVRDWEGQTVNVCLPKVGECGGQTCPQGWVCVDDACADPCDPSPCDWWETCSAGACLDRTCTGAGQSCPTGSFCVNHECVGDPCLTAGCDPYAETCVRACDAETCAATCEAACTCPPDQRCLEPGVCSPDPCAGVTCETGQRCAPATGQCEADPCAYLTCGSGTRCFEGQCVDDPCALLQCPLYHRCVVSAGVDGEGSPVPLARCQADSAYWVEGGGRTEVIAAGGACTCAAAAPGEAAGMLLLLLPGVALLLGARRRARRDGGAR